MKSRAALLAEIEENRLKNKKLPPSIDELRVLEGDEADGYDPYDCPGRPRAPAGHKGPATTPRGR